MITIREIKKVGFKEAKEHDFHDDGNNFKGFEYEGVVISYLKTYGNYYFSIRTDYMSGLNYEEYSTLPSYKDTDKFNGVEEMTIEDLEEAKEICVRIKKEYKDKLDKIEEVSNETIKRLQDRVDLEVIRLQHYLENIKTDVLNLLLSDNISDYQVRTVRDYYKSLEREVNNKLIIMELNDQQIRRRENQLKECGYIYIKPECFYVKQLNQMLGKIV